MEDLLVSNPWSGVEPVREVREAHVSVSSIWPDRLLHVPTMRSHRNNGQNVYGNVLEPRYNILSYTWGYYQDKSENPNKQHVVIHGIDWEIPSIYPDYFTPRGFHLAMERAAQGVRKDSCEWLWVDIACVPQQPQDEEAESEECVRLRKQEIGRQAAIFARAQEPFIWLSKLKTTDIWGAGESPIHAAALNHCTHPFHPNKKIDLDDAALWLRRLNDGSISYTQWLYRILDHPWFKSLWTLQEMILRPDAYFLFDDGLLNLDGSQAQAMQDSNNSGKFCLFNLQLETSILDRIIRNPFHAWENMGYMETKLDYPDSRPIPSVREIHRRLDGTLKRTRELGLTYSNSEPPLPHIAYSAAQHRRVGRLLDRIYGIVQTYRISCNPDPPGATPEKKLEALEDDFGTQLVSLFPIKSQTFIHASHLDRQPRRSWLITQGCKVDGWWGAFEDDNHKIIINLTDYFRINAEHFAGPHVVFKGRAWYLDSFVQDNSSDILNHLDKYDSPKLYNGMLLDYHVSETVLGHKIDYFNGYDDVKQAVEKLARYYGQDSSAQGTHSLRVASLGCSFAPGDHCVKQVGIILAPAREEYCNICGEVEVEHWIRIGLMRWVEDYKRYGLGKKHPELPPPHEFQCMIE
ncbi:hypothetical protein F5B19DRAFT_503970 [Rostrohypoxylon terebratum]|nr:hypothetical protein F5B19DRAFT_503970 [Rostrohypoxylon terebratum]